MSQSSSPTAALAFITAACHGSSVSLMVVLGLAAGAVVAAGLAAASRWLFRRPSTQSTDGPPDPKPDVTQGLQIGDVVMLDGVDAWATGALELREADSVVACVFLGPSPRDPAILWRADRAELLVGLTQLDDVQLAALTDVIEFGGRLFRRMSRLPVEITPRAQVSLPVGERGLWFVYENHGGERLVCLQSGDKIFAWLEQPDDGQALRLAAGKATLRDL